MDVRWALSAAALGTALGLRPWKRAIVEQELKVVILDPIYTALLAGSKETQATNIFQMGPLLADITAHLSGRRRDADFGASQHQGQEL